MQVQLGSGVPVFSVVLTPKDFHEHDTHRAFFRDHFVAKGAEAARACRQTLALHARPGGLKATRACRSARARAASASLKVLLGRITASVFFGSGW